MKVLHIGCLVEKMSESIEEYKKLGFELIGDTIVNGDSGIIGQYMHNGDTVIELLTPVDEKSKIYSILKKQGSSLHHICYGSDDFINDIKTMRKRGYIIISKEEKTNENNHNSAMLYNTHLGLIELFDINQNS